MILSIDNFTNYASYLYCDIIICFYDLYTMNVQKNDI